MSGELPKTITVNDVEYLRKDLIDAADLDSMASDIHFRKALEERDKVLALVEHSIQAIQDEIDTIADKSYMCYDHVKKAEYIAYIDGLEFALERIKKAVDKN